MTADAPPPLELLMLLDKLVRKYRNQNKGFVLKVDCGPAMFSVRIEEPTEPGAGKWQTMTFRDQ